MSKRWTEETVRLFVACDLPRDVGYEVSQWQARALEPHDDVRVTGSLHITLCFLGSLPRTKIDGITDALAGIRFTPFTLGFGEPIFLPERGARRVVALPLDDPSGALTALQADVAAELAARQLYKPEKRRYLPHLTVARYRHPGHPFPLQNVTVGEFGVDRMVLYSSLLERAGAVHTPVATFPASQ